MRVDLSMNVQPNTPFHRKFVYAPAGRERLAVAASRAGAIGCVSFDHLATLETLSTALDALGHPLSGAHGPFGLRLPSLEDDIVAEINLWANKGLTWVIVPTDALEAYFNGSPTWLSEDIALLAEVTDCGTHPALDRVDGLVVKGNEAPGFVGEESSFILFQHWVKTTKLPLYVHGGLSPQVCAGLSAMGAAGGVFDCQLYLTKDAALPAATAQVLRALTGTETVMLGDPAQGSYLRVLQHPRAKAGAAFGNLHQLSPIADIRAALASTPIGLDDPASEVMLLGHDVAMAASYGERYKTVARFLRAVDEAVSTLPSLAVDLAPLRKRNEFASSFDIDVPIIQGPMTRVSDSPAFAAAVAKAGALPTLALALMRPEQVETMVDETKALIGDGKWGVGFLGFLPQAQFKAQMDVVLAREPDFAIIAGGRPDQAAKLEEIGVPTYLHLPSASLLDYYIKNGSRRFIFEGRECGGHIGPISSFVLWSSMIDRICEEIDAGRVKGPDLDCVFAGGLHDALSSAFLQVLVAPLAARGVHVAMIVGTAYILTKEIAETGAIQSKFQEVVRDNPDTAILTSGPGHASRSMRTPFVDSFVDKQKALRDDSEMPEEDKREVLDDMIMGTLRIASKGTRRNSETSEIEPVPEAEQFETGMYMIGQVASLRDDLRDIADLHDSLTDAAGEMLRANAMPEIAVPVEDGAAPLDIAIVGMSAALPGAMSKETYWQNILGKVDSVVEIPRHRWDWRLYFDEDRKAKDKIYSRWGGFLEDMPFEPGDFGITPKSLLSVDPMQLMALKIADEALGDAGYSDMDKGLRDHTAVMIGASGGSGDVGLQYNLRSETPRFEGGLEPALAERLPEWSEDTFAGILINVISGRITNRLDLGGPNYTTDAACASSLAAVYQACNELRWGRSRMAIAGGVDTQQSPFGFMCFSQTQALSPRGRSRSFDKSADGIAISEGIVMLVLKPLADAEADGDRIYAVIKGVGSSSDGKGKALSAPEAAGQLRAMRRAYDQAGYTPADVQLFEAHGTGTVVGDSTELTSTGNLVAETSPRRRSAVIGSVKTNIGHTKATAGIAGMAKIALALHHKVLPPHRGVDAPNDVLATDEAPLYLLNAAEPWIADSDEIRRASVSAFGFGGTNFHATLEEYRGEYREEYRHTPSPDWPAELLVLSGADRAALAQSISDILARIAAAPALKPRFLTSVLGKSFDPQAGSRAALIITDMADAAEKLTALQAHLQSDAPLPDGMFVQDGAAEKGKLAVLFPGQGSQYPFMGREPAVYLRELSETLSGANRALSASLGARYGAATALSEFIYPRGAYDDDARKAGRAALTSTDIAQPSLGAVEAGLWAFLAGRLGLSGDMFAGHSYGEFVAHHAAGVLSFEDLMAVSEARGRLIVEKAAEAGSELGTMIAISASREEAEAIANEIEDLVVANHNSPSQVILSGPEAAVASAQKAAEAKGFNATRLPVAAAFHSQLMAPARDDLGKVIRSLVWKTDAASAVYSNARAAQHGEDVCQAMTDHLVAPVNFVDQVRAMYDNGARLFLEIGPKRVLSGLVRQILGDQDVLSISTDGENGSLQDLLTAIGALAVAGAPLDLARLYDGRGCDSLTMADLDRLGQPSIPSKRGWWINGSGVRKAAEPQATIGLTKEQADALFAELPLAAEAQSTAPQAAPTASPGEAFTSRLPIAQSATPSTSVSFIPRGDRMYDNPPPMADSGSGRSVSAEFFSLMARIVESAETVACAELGAAPSGSTGLRGGHRRTALRPAPKPQALTASVPEAAPFAPPAPMPAAMANPMAPAPTPVEPVAPAPAPAMPAAAAPAPAPAPAAAPEPAPAPVAVDLKAVLLSVVTDKTGYDEDILEMDQNIEADLGIDSIKRVDIVAGVVESLPAPIAEKLGDEERSALNGAKTLDGMLEILTKAEAAANFNLAVADNSSDQSPVATPPKIDALPRPDQSRFIVSPRSEPMPEDIRSALTEGDLVITASGGAIDAALIAALEEAGSKTHLIPAEALTDEAALTAWLETNGPALGRLAGLVHLAGLGLPALDLSATPEAWREQLFRSEKAAYILLRDLEFAPAAHAVSVTDLGGFFGRGETPSEALRLQGGGVGLLKSLLREDEARRCKAIDLDSSLETDALVAQIMGEMQAQGGRVEVGYPAGIRTVFRTEPAPILPGTPEADADGEVILATGGARGITAETLRELAAPGVVFILTGRSPLPEQSATLRDDPALAAMSETELARHFVKSEKMPIAEGRRRASKVMASREMLDCLAAYESAGASVEYLPVDVNDSAAVKEMIDGIYERHGRLDGVVHGAGVIEDKLLRDIPSDSWDRVVETKVIGLLSLMSALRPESLKFLYAFTSVAGRYGNAGQTSYATANELMARICSQWQAQIGGATRVKAMSWGPWGATSFGAGMVTAETERKFRAQGVCLVHARLGADLLRMETRCALRAPQTEVIYGAAPWEAAEASRSILQTNAPGGLLAHSTVDSAAGGKQQMAVRIEDWHPFLQDHIIETDPVLPMAIAIEIMASAVRDVFGDDLRIIGVADAKLFHGVKFDTDHKDLVAVLSQNSHGMETEESVSVKLFGSDDKRRPHYAARFILAQNFAPAPASTALIAPPEAKVITAAEAYGSHLFHGPSFHALENVDAIWDHGMLVSTRASLPRELLGDAGATPWLFDPFLIDGIAQLPYLWSHATRGTIALPISFEKITRYTEDLSGAASIEWNITKDTPELIVSESLIRDENGQVLLSASGMTHGSRPPSDAMIMGGSKAA
ncbi:MAG: SDR family NAD(P)-dependent oxidoreductase [Mangrovicoccus sp.]|nr:SDR family NAD(P)-dependent oxidoreductase [Mangrovicoccus sp.]